MNDASREHNRNRSTSHATRGGFAREPRLVAPDGTPFAPDASDLLDEARARVQLAEERERQEGQRVARRLVGAFVVVVVLFLVGFVGLPLLGIYFPPYVWGLIFLTIVVGTVMSLIGERPAEESNGDPGTALAVAPGEDPDGCAVGCCPGPRPLRMFRDR